MQYPRLFVSLLQITAPKSRNCYVSLAQRHYSTYALCITHYWRARIACQFHKISPHYRCNELHTGFRRHPTVRDTEGQTVPAHSFPRHVATPCACAYASYASGKTVKKLLKKLLVFHLQSQSGIHGSNFLSQKKWFLIFAA